MRPPAPRPKKLVCLCNVCTFLLIFASGGVSGLAQSEGTRSVEALAAAHDGSWWLASIADGTSNVVVAFDTASGHVRWRFPHPGVAEALAISGDGHRVALGYRSTNDSEAGLEVLDAATGKPLASVADAPGGDSLGMGFASWGAGVSDLAFAPSGTLFGLSNDTIFSWSPATKDFGWAEEAPDRRHEAEGHNGPTGHVTSFALSADGTRLAVARDRGVYMLAAEDGSVLAQRLASPDSDGGMSLAFSPDRRLLALGQSLATAPRGFITHVWAPDGGSTVLPGCGWHIAWAADSKLLACQNSTGAHLRNIRDPQKDIGAAGPVSDQPILKVGNSLWVAAYKTTDWKEPSKPLPLTLVELGTGKRVTVTLPGR